MNRELKAWEGVERDYGPECGWVDSRIQEREEYRHARTRHVPFALSCEILINAFICYKQTERNARCLPVSAMVRSLNSNTSYNESPCYIDNQFTRSVKGVTIPKKGASHSLFLLYPTRGMGGWMDKCT